MQFKVSIDVIVRDSTQIGADEKLLKFVRILGISNFVQKEDTELLFNGVTNEQKDRLKHNMYCNQG